MLCFSVQMKFKQLVILKNCFEESDIPINWVIQCTQGFGWNKTEKKLKKKYVIFL